jgi:hypothetical protein
MGRVRGVLVAGGLAVVVSVVAPAAVGAARGPAVGGAVFVHSARSGELGGGRLTLRGVGARVTWTDDTGRAGTLSIKRMHLRAFGPGHAAVTATLHVAGQRPGHELVFTLTQPRYSRGTVSYAVKPLNHGRLPDRTAQAARDRRPVTRQFGDASLTVVDPNHPMLAIVTTGDPYSCGVSPACWGTLVGSDLTPDQPGEFQYTFLISVPPEAGGGTEEGIAEGFFLVSHDGTVNQGLGLVCRSNPPGPNPSAGPATAMATNPGTSTPITVQSGTVNAPCR